MDLLLDVNIVVDLCTPRLEWYGDARAAIDRCRAHKGRIWLYVGSVQTMEYTLRRELQDRSEALRQPLSQRAAAQMARFILREFALDKHWLAALAEEGGVFESDDPEDEQFIRAMERFNAGDICLLTRDERLKARTPLAKTPAEYLDFNLPDVSMDFIDLKTQQNAIRPDLEKRIHRVLHHGQYIMGPEIKELEARLAKYVGVAHAISCASGTDALLMALMAYGVGPGDAIFTTPFTFIATAEVISLLGATPVFVDIDPHTFNLDPAKLDLAIQALKANDPSIHPLPLVPSPAPLACRGIIAVDLFGLPADYDRINAVARAHGLFVIEDAAQSFGAEYNGRKCCSLADIGCTSFFPAKPLGCYGDGGMCFTDDDNIADVMKSIRVHGKGGHKYDNVRIGINGRLDTLQAAILLAKFEIFPKEVNLRQQAADGYSHLFSAVRNEILPPYVPSGSSSVWAQYSLLSRAEENRAAMQQSIKQAGVPTAIYYPKPLHLQQPFESLGYNKGDFAVSETHAERIFSIPMHPYLREQDQEEIVKTIHRSCGS